MNRVVIRRFKHFSGKEYLGTLIVFDEDGNLLYDCKTLELSWKENRTSISCIPGGIYQLVLEYSSAFRRYLWEIKGVPYRSECKIHAANYHEQIEGCIAVGFYHKDIDSDGIIDIAESRNALKDFHLAMGNETKSIIEIIQGYGTA